MPSYGDKVLLIEKKTGDCDMNPKEFILQTKNYYFVKGSNGYDKKLYKIKAVANHLIEAFKIIDDDSQAHIERKKSYAARLYRRGYRSAIINGAFGTLNTLRSLKNEEVLYENQTRL